MHPGTSTKTRRDRTNEGEQSRTFQTSQTRRISIYISVLKTGKLATKFPLEASLPAINFAVGLFFLCLKFPANLLAMDELGSPNGYIPGDLDRCCSLASGTGVLGPLARLLKAETADAPIERVVMEGEIVALVVIARARSRYIAPMTVEEMIPASSSPSMECVAGLILACWSRLSSIEGRTLCKNIGKRDHPPDLAPLPIAPVMPVNGVANMYTANLRCESISSASVLDPLRHSHRVSRNFVGVVYKSRVGTESPDIRLEGGTGICGWMLCAEDVFNVIPSAAARLGRAERN